ncbi:hypothetical protein PM082_024158 [Marasmius tenuissimus]|nr:hypothetical protein PM082_024158 [Marasmius tenuissimus]
MDSLPSLDELVEKASIIVQKYVSLGGYENTLSTQLQADLGNDTLKVQAGSSWTSPSVPQPSAEQMASTEKTKSDNNTFDGDRTLANSILFKMQMGSWLLLEYGIKDGVTRKCVHSL